MREEERLANREREGEQENNWRGETQQGLTICIYDINTENSMLISKILTIF